MNPGSVSVPKEDNIASVAVYENGEITFINVETGENIK
jgi:predicted phosphodiesterase